MKPETLFTDKWSGYLKFFDKTNSDIYFTEEYAKLYENDLDKAECFVYAEDKNIFLFPYMKRKVCILNGKYFDFETPYGYGGPITNSPDNGFVKRAVDMFGNHALENNIIAGMIRFHPIMCNEALLRDKCEVVFDRYTIAMDLTPGVDDIWKDQIHSKHRNSITKAMKSGLTYRVDRSPGHLKEFARMYRSTMSRIEADGFYIFSDEYFDNMRNLKENIFLGLVYLKDKMIAGAVFFKYGIFGHYHLAGSDDTYSTYSPNNFLIYKTAIHLKELGVGIFHLGGGSDKDPKNSLFKFKARFSKNRLPFNIGKIVINKNMYKKACTVWENSHPGTIERYKNYILKYRLE